MNALYLQDKKRAGHYHGNLPLQCQWGRLQFGCWREREVMEASCIAWRFPHRAAAAAGALLSYVGGFTLYSHIGGCVIYRSDGGIEGKWRGEDGRRICPGMSPAQILDVHNEAKITIFLLVPSLLKVRGPKGRGLSNDLVPGAPSPYIFKKPMLKLY